MLPSILFPPYFHHPVDSYCIEGTVAITCKQIPEPSQAHSLLLLLHYNWNRDFASPILFYQFGIMNTSLKTVYPFIILVGRPTAGLFQFTYHTCTNLYIIFMNVLHHNLSLRFVTIRLVSLYRCFEIIISCLQSFTYLLDHKKSSD